MTLSVQPSRIGGALSAPASKSSMQRAVACALLAPGKSLLLNPAWCDDSEAALGVAADCGAAVSRFSDRVAIEGVQVGEFGKSEHAGAENGRPRLVLDCGESGLCIRMFSAIAALEKEPVELSARGSLRLRPVDMVVGALEQAGVWCRAEGGRPPVLVRGPLRPGTFRVDGTRSSQFLTGLLIALGALEGDSVVEIDRLASRGYVDLTIAVMSSFGILAVHDDCYNKFTVFGRGGYRAAEYRVEGDWSGAAFLLGAAAVSGSLSPAPDDRLEPLLRLSGLQADSAQPDRAVLEALRSAGADVRELDGQLCVYPASLRGFRFDATDCPDLFPPLCALALACDGETRLRGVSRLAEKECDRAEALIGEFGAAGARLFREGDELVVTGLATGTADSPRAGSTRTVTIHSRGDHRIAMAGALAALLLPGETVIEGAECVAKSYPEFWKDYSALGGRVSELSG